MKTSMVVLSVLGAGVLVGTSPAFAECSFRVRGTVMSLTGDCQTEETIFIPDGMTLDGRGFTITAVESEPGGWKGAVVRNEGASANVRNVIIATSNLACECNTSEPDERLRGILLEDAAGSVVGSTILSAAMATPCGCQEGNGIEARHAPYDGSHPSTLTVEFRGNHVEGFQKNGIGVSGDLSARISDNVVVGAGETDVIAQNGIQVSYGALARVENNEVDGQWFSGLDWSSSGILIFETDGALVASNHVSAAQTAISVGAWCWQAPSADNNTIASNEIELADYGVDVSAWNIGGYSACDAEASRNRVADNVLDGQGGLTGLYVGVGEDFCPCDDYTPVADGNTLIRNTVNGFEEAIVDEGTNTHIVEGTIRLGRFGGRDRRRPMPTRP